jgi:hypothetical protein
MESDSCLIKFNSLRFQLIQWDYFTMHASPKVWNFMLLLITVLSHLLSSNAYAIPSAYYFTEQDGPNRSIFYKAFCATNAANKGLCSLKAITIGNSKANQKCGITVDTLYEWGEATLHGQTWLVSSNEGLCGYTNTYHISDTGMIQIKTAPKIKKAEICESFEPKTYKMKSHPNVSTIRLNTEGCSELNIQSFN